MSSRGSLSCAADRAHAGGVFHHPQTGDEIHGEHSVEFSQGVGWGLQGVAVPLRTARPHLQAIGGLSIQTGNRARQHIAIPGDGVLEGASCVRSVLHRNNQQYRQQHAHAALKCPVSELDPRHAAKGFSHRLYIQGSGLCILIAAKRETLLWRKEFLTSVYLEGALSHMGETSTMRKKTWVTAAKAEATPAA